MLNYDVASKRALDAFSNQVRYSEERIKKSIDTKCFSWAEIYGFVSSDLNYYLGMVRSFRIIYHDEIVKNDVLSMHLEVIYDRLLSDIRSYYYSVMGIERGENDDI